MGCIKEQKGSGHADICCGENAEDVQERVVRDLRIAGGNAVAVYFCRERQTMVGMNKKWKTSFFSRIFHPLTLHDSLFTAFRGPRRERGAGRATCPTDCVSGQAGNRTGDTRLVRLSKSGQGQNRTGDTRLFRTSALGILSNSRRFLPLLSQFPGWVLTDC